MNRLKGNCLYLVFILALSLSPASFSRSAGQADEGETVLSLEVDKKTRCKAYGPDDKGWVTVNLSDVPGEASRRLRRSDSDLVEGMLHYSPGEGKLKIKIKLSSSDAKISYAMLDNPPRVVLYALEPPDPDAPLPELKEEDEKILSSFRFDPGTDDDDVDESLDQEGDEPSIDDQGYEILTSHALAVQPLLIPHVSGPYEFSDSEEGRKLAELASELDTGSPDKAVEIYNRLNEVEAKELFDRESLAFMTAEAAARACHRNGKCRDAADMYERVLSWYPESNLASSGLVNQAITYLDLGIAPVAHGLAARAAQNEKDKPDPDRAVICRAGTVIGESLMRMGKFGDAARAFDLTSSQRSCEDDRGWDMARMAEALTKAGNYREAWDAVNNVEEYYPEIIGESIHWDVHKGEAAFQLGYVEEANKAFARYLDSGAEKEGRSFALMRLGDLARTLEGQEQADEYYKRCYEEFPGTCGGCASLLKLARARIGEKGGKSGFNAAMEYLDHAQRTCPGKDYLPDILYRRGVAYYSQGQYEETLTAFNEAMAHYSSEDLEGRILKEGPRVVGEYIEQVRKAGMHGKAVWAYETFPDFLPEDAINEVADSLNRLSANVAAEELLEDAIETDFDNFDYERAMVLLAESLLQSDRIERARQISQKYLEIFPAGERVHNAKWVLARCDEMDGNLQSAIENYRFVLISSSEYGQCELLVSVAAAHFGNKSPREALAYYDRALAGTCDPEKEDGRYDDALYGRAEALRKLGRQSEAVRAYGKALKKNPDHPMAQFARLHLADGLAQTGNADEANKKYREAASSSDPLVAELAKERSRICELKQKYAWMEKY